MTNEQLITGLTARNVQCIQASMQRGRTYSEALAQAKSESIAGPAVWPAVEAHFAANDPDAIGHEAALPNVAMSSDLAERLFTKPERCAMKRHAEIARAMGADFDGIPRGAA
jgi:hypothetical protein